MSTALEDSEDVSWITGHSLGGAAATFYKMVIDSPNAELVTFGAMPTYPTSASTATFYDWNGEGGVAPGEIPDKENYEGIRYFHKFDPATSYYFQMMSAKHQVETP